MVIEGHVRLVEFQTFGEWFLSVTLDEQFSKAERGNYQIDGADYFLDNQRIPKLALVEWLARRFAQKEGMPKVKITGNFGAYQTCEKVEFFTPE
jgi:hypothetical protein